MFVVVVVVVVIIVVDVTFVIMFVFSIALVITEILNIYIICRIIHYQNVIIMHTTIHVSEKINTKTNSIYIYCYYTKILELENVEELCSSKTRNHKHK